MLLRPILRRGRDWENAVNALIFAMESQCQILRLPTNLEIVVIHANVEDMGDPEGSWVSQDGSDIVGAGQGVFAKTAQGFEITFLEIKRGKAWRENKSFLNRGIRIQIADALQERNMPGDSLLFEIGRNGGM